MRLLHFTGRIWFLSVAALTAWAADGVCKNAPMPRDYVAVGEMNSTECEDGGNPFAKNAWLAAPATDGTIACELPSYKTRGARLASLVPCELVQGPACEPRLDGLPNAILLRNAPACVSAPAFPQSRDLFVMCGSISPVPFATTDPKKTPGGYLAIAAVPADCPGEYRPRFLTATKGWLFAALSESPSGQSVCATQAGIADRGWFSARFEEGGVIVRRFYNPDCPADPDAAGSELGLTAWIVLHGKGIPKDEMTLCIGFNESVKRPVYQRKTEGVHYFYAETCGGPSDQPNAFRAKLSADGFITVLP